MQTTRYGEGFGRSMLWSLRTESGTDVGSTGDDELLAPDNTYHVLFQGGEL